MSSHLCINNSCAIARQCAISLIAVFISPRCTCTTTGLFSEIKLINAIISVEYNRSRSLLAKAVWSDVRLYRSYAASSLEQHDGRNS